MDVFDLYAKIGLDKSEYEAGLNDAKGSMSNLAKSVGNGLKTVAKVGAAAVTAAAAGVAALTKMGVEGYAEYEQLVGGVETLFKTSQSAVMAYAENAYKTAGMSANEYMSTVTSFSASLIQSLGGDTAKAAEIGDMAITDMSDNANKMGTSIEMIQNAYNGFAKGNFTMLDNLKLGYGGTKEEMERLIADANRVKEANGEMADLSMDSFADVAEAIHIIQTEMGITGTTAREAASTIEGSLSMMKGAWQNLVVGMADENANMEVLINNFVDSAATAAENLLPRIEQTLAGIGKIIEDMAPVISEALPGMIETVLPSLITAGANLLSALATSIIESAPELLQAALEAIKVILTEGLGVSAETASNAVGVLETAFTAVGETIEFVIDNINVILPILGTLAAVIGTVTTATTLYNTVQAVKAAMDAAQVTTVWALVSAHIAQAAAAAAAIAPYILIVAAIAAVIAIIVLCIKHWDEIVKAVEVAVSAIGKFLSNLWEGIKNGVVTAWNWICDILGTVATWIYDNVIAPVAKFFVDLWKSIVSAYHTVIDPWIEIFKRLSVIVNDEVITPIKKFFVDLWKKITSGARDAWDSIVSVFSAVSGWFNEKIIQPVGDFFKKMWSGLKSGASDAWAGIKSVFSSVTSWFKDTFSKAWQKVKDVFSTGGKVFDGIKDGIVSTFKTVVNAIIGGINKVIKVPFDAINGVLKKIRDIEIVGIKPFNWVTTFSVPQIPKLSTGLNYVPYDEYPAFLHRGEAVLTAAQARAWRNGQGTALGGDNGQIVSVLIAILNAINGGNEELLRAMLSGNTIVLNEREFARAVRTYA